MALDRREQWEFENLRKTSVFTENFKSHLDIGNIDIRPLN